MISFFLFFFIEKILKPKEVSVKVLIFVGTSCASQTRPLDWHEWGSSEISKEMGFNLATDAHSSVNVGG